MMCTVCGTVHLALSRLRWFCSTKCVWVLFGRLGMYLGLPSSPIDSGDERVACAINHYLVPTVHVFGMSSDDWADIECARRWMLAQDDKLVRAIRTGDVRAARVALQLGAEGWPRVREAMEALAQRAGCDGQPSTACAVGTVFALHHDAGIPRWLCPRAMEGALVALESAWRSGCADLLCAWDVADETPCLPRVLGDMVLAYCL